MKPINKSFLILFIPTLIFLLAFTGLYMLIEMNFALNDGYVFFSFTDSKPTNAGILLIGFRNVKEIFFMVLLTTIFTVISVGITKKDMIKNAGKTRTVFHSVTLTFLLTFLHTGYRVFNAIGYDKESFGIFWKDLQNETIAFFIIFLFISVPVGFLFSRQLAKSMRFGSNAEHTEPHLRDSGDRN